MGRDVDRDEALPEREPVEAADRGRAAPQARRRESRIVGSAAARAGREVPRRRVRTPGPVPGRAARSAEVIEGATVRPNRGGGDPPPPPGVGEGGGPGCPGPRRGPAGGRGPAAPGFGRVQQFSSLRQGRGARPRLPQPAEHGAQLPDPALAVEGGNVRDRPTIANALCGPAGRAGVGGAGWGGGGETARAGGRRPAPQGPPPAGAAPPPPMPASTSSNTRVGVSS